jgi:hypothetical protein
LPIAARDDIVMMLTLEMAQFTVNGLSELLRA